MGTQDYRVARVEASAIGIFFGPERVHKHVQPAIRNSGYWEKLKRIDDVPNKEPDNRKDHEIDNVQRQNQSEKYWQTVRRRPFRPPKQILQVTQLNCSLSEREEDFAFFESHNKYPELRGDAQHRRSEQRIIEEILGQDVDEIRNCVDCGKEGQQKKLKARADLANQFPTAESDSKYRHAGVALRNI